MLWSKVIGAGGAGGAGGVVEGWNVSTAVFNQSFSVSAQSSSPLSVFFKPDGLKMYVLAIDGKVYSYSLSTSWDVSTATFVLSFNAGAQSTYGSAIVFKPDGLKMYILDSGYATGTGYQYTLSTAWDIGTASYDSVSFSFEAQENFSSGLYFKPDGLKMYMVGGSTDKIYSYSLSTAWDIGTAIYDGINFSVTAQEGSPRSLFFKPDGLKFYVSGGSNAVYEYDVSTDWDLSAATFVQSFSFASQDTGNHGIFFRYDGTIMYMVGFAGDSVYQYDLTA